MTHPRILPGGALAAATYYAEREGTPEAVSLAEAGALHGVTRQAVHAATRDPGRFARSRPQGRKRVPGAGRPSISVYVADGVLVYVRPTADEVKVWTRAAGSTPLGTWLAEISARTRPREGEIPSSWLRRIANERVTRRRAARKP